MSKLSSPLVSVVMPTLNQVAFIRESIQSVLYQEYSSVELIVMDGGSTDGTLDLLNEFSKNDKRVRWKSGSDSGPADALNKAFQMCRGTIIGWLNSDDLYTPGAIERAVKGFDVHRDWMMLYGHGQHVDSHGQHLEVYPTKNPVQASLREFQNGCFICQPTVFFKPTLLTLSGKLNPNLKTAFDFDLWLRVFKLFPERVGFIDCVQAYSRLHQGSITLRQRRQVFIESMSLISRYVSDPPAHWLITYADEMRKNKASIGLSEIRAELYQIIQVLDPQPSVSGLVALKLAVDQYTIC